MKRKHFFLIPLSLLISFGIFGFNYAQERPSPTREVSGSIGNTDVKVVYGSPGVKDRTVWGEVVPYNQLWRTGANEATTIEVGSDVMIQGQTLPAGKYSLFTIPKENSDWVVIFNKVEKQWGAFDYDQSEDAMRIMASPAKADFNERLKFEIDEAGDNEGKVKMYWDNLMLPIEIRTR
ncbi:DUF2911 domain-containing protein [Roseivirga sp. BDSF3-8]|uniref:DUF2911 domain-containing protein n=1 Tax=Roseivirga sp. BDSF3-8 TaxID=3241598 RepID=UPI0035318A95